MNARLAVLVLAGLGSASAGPMITMRDLVGTWRCGPVAMQGPNVTVTSSWKMSYNLDGTYNMHTTSVVTAPAKPAITLQDRSSGTWKLDAGILTTHVQISEFLSASDPSITKESGQKAQDAQLKKKSVYEWQILQFSVDRYRAIPINSMYKEAAVESGCERT